MWWATVVGVLGGVCEGTGTELDETPLVGIFRQTYSISYFVSLMTVVVYDMIYIWGQLYTKPQISTSSADHLETECQLDLPFDELPSVLHFLVG